MLTPGTVASLARYRGYDSTRFKLVGNRRSGCVARETPYELAADERPPHGLL